MADEIIFWDESNSTADDPKSKGIYYLLLLFTIYLSSFGIYQEFLGRLNAL
jgi:hypothetical protein